MWKNSISIAVESHNSALSCPTVLGYRNHLESIGIKQKLGSTKKLYKKIWRHTLMTISIWQLEFYIVFKAYSISGWNWKRKKCLSSINQISTQLLNSSSLIFQHWIYSVLPFHIHLFFPSFLKVCFG